jgi:hypothetical protein
MPPGWESMPEKSVVQEYNPFDAVCSQHHCHPEKCWDQHNVVPTDHRAQTPEELRTSIEELHLKWQKEGGKPKELMKEERERNNDNPAEAQHGASAPTASDKGKV